MQNIIMKLLEISLFSSLMILVVIALKAAFGSRINNRVLSIMWLLIMIRMVMPLTIDSPFHLRYNVKETEPITVSETSAEKEQVLHTFNSDVEQTNHSISNIQINTNTESVATTNKPIESHKLTLVERTKDYVQDLNLWSIGFGLWIFGCVYFLAVKIYRIMKMKSNIRNYSEQSENLTVKLYNLKKLIGLKQDVRIAESIFIDTPIVFGIITPIIILPKGLTKKIESKKLNMIILHELCHIKRLDILKNFVWLVFKCVYWFNPFIYIGYKSYLDDIEDACDIKVVSYLSKELKCEYAQSLLDVVRIAKHDDKFPVAVSFCEDKSTLEKRITNMIRPKSKLMSVGVVSVVLCVVMLFGCFTTACLPNKKNGIDVLSSDNSALIPDIDDKKEALALHEDKISNNDETDFEIISIEESFDTNDSNITVAINADINLKKDMQIQIADVSYSEISVDFVKNAAEVLFEGAKAYEPRVELTKSELQAEIDTLEFALANPEQSNSDGLNSDDPSDTIRLFEDRIKIYKEFMKTAPKEIISAPAEFTFIPSRNYEEPAMLEEHLAEMDDAPQSYREQELHRLDHEMMIIADATLPTGLYGRVQARNYESEKFNRAFFEFIKSDELDAAFRPHFKEREGMTLSEQEALSFADKAIKDLGLVDFTLCKISKNTTPMVEYDEEAEQIIYIPLDEVETTRYTFDYTRSFGGVPARVWIYRSFSNKKDTPLYDCENIRVYVDEIGISSICWDNKVEVSDIIENDVEIMDIDEMIEKTKLFLINDLSIDKLFSDPSRIDRYEDDFNKVELHIDDIKLVMVRQPIEGKPYEYRMSPAWQFEGCTFIDLKSKEKTYEEVKEYQYKDIQLYVDAIDGSIIE